jgi:hypothetical protein
MLFIKNFSEFVDYFRDLAGATTYFKFFQAGGAERIVSERLLSDGRSRVASPVFFLEWPFVKVNDYGTANTLVRFNAAFVILENPEKENWTAQDEAMNNTYQAVMQVLNKLKVDSQELSKRFLYVDLNLLSIDPIENLLIDQWYGWRCEFTVICPLEVALYEDCLEPGFWKEEITVSLY